MKPENEPGKILIDIGVGIMATFGIIGGLWVLFYWVFVLGTIANS